MTPYLSASEVAALRGVTRMAVQHARKRGALKAAVKIGSAAYGFTHKAALAWVITSPRAGAKA